MSQSKRTRTRHPSVQNPEEIEQEVNQRPFHKEICFPEDPSNPLYNSIREAHLAGMIQRKTPGNATFVKHFHISTKRYQATNRIGCRDKRVYLNSQRIKMFYDCPPFLSVLTKLSGHILKGNRMTFQGMRLLDS